MRGLLFDDNKTLSEIGRKYSVSGCTVKNNLSKIVDKDELDKQINSVLLASKSGSKNPNAGKKLEREKFAYLRAAFYENSAGYIMIRSPYHPYSDVRGYVMEHRLVMEKYLRRFLLPDEIVHHRDSDKKNNTIENLEVMHQKVHALEHSLSIVRDEKTGRFLQTIARGVKC